MTIYGQSYFTALTAKIQMGGQTVGALQSLRVDDNYNLARVGQIGTPLDIENVPGRVQVNVSARRMALNLDLINSVLRPTVTSDTVGTVPGETARAGVVGRESEISYGDLSTVIKSTNSKFSTIDSTQYQMNAKKYFNFMFDIDVYDDSGNLFFTIRKCTIVSRSFTIDQANVIIATDVTIYGRYLDYGSGGATSLTQASTGGGVI